MANLCKCIRNLRYFIDLISGAEDKAREGDFKRASWLVADALSEVRDLESCLGVSLDETREHLEKAYDELLYERKAGIRNLDEAKLSVFREIEDKVCK